VPWVRRTRHLSLAPGESDPPSVTARSLLTGATASLSVEELGALLALSDEEWAWRVDPLVDTLASHGLVVSDEPAEPFVALRRRDAELTRLGWHPEAAAFHLATRWESVQARVPGRDGTPARRLRRKRPPLAPFHERGGERVELPPGDADAPLFDVLHRRRTVRSFAPDEPVTLDELAILLRHVWGVHGTVRIAGGDTALHKTSPSGGGLHPVEVYPLVRRVDGLAPGVYHYRTQDHALERLGELPADGLDRATAGQWYFADADVGFAMTARFGRSFWKYRRHLKAYRTLLLDAGHLSQTFYLVCTELGLGPYVTAALNDDVLEGLLALDPLVEAPLALCGCGRLPSEPSRLDPSFS
jgi:putative peptide maturation dehydrogenase